MNRHLAYQPEIDGLRAIAVLSVVGFHAFPDFVRGGYVGVDVFFVISGYLITGIVARGLSLGTFSIIDFYVARIRRILPALALVLGSCLIFGYTALFPDEFKQLALHVIGAIGFASNIVLWRESGYFDEQSITKPLLHLWSLGIEEQFYLVWPFILGLGFRFGARLLWLVTALAIASFAANLLLIESHPSATFYLPFTRAWELLVGAMLALSPLRPRNNLLLNLCSLAGLGLVAIAVLQFTQSTQFPGWAAVLPTMGAALLILGGRTTAVGQILAKPPFTAVGLISYPLYLWHWPLLSFASIINGDHLDGQTVWLLVAASFLLATLTYLLVERPAQKGIRAVPMRALVPVVVILGLGSASWVVFSQDGMSNRPAVVQARAAAEQVGGPLWSYSENDVCRDQYPAGWELFCIQSKPGQPTIMLVGNSYANHLYPGAVAAFQNETVLSIGTCDPAAGGNDNSDCVLQDSIIAASDDLKLVILSSDWNGEFPPQRVASLRRRIDWITKLGKTVVIFGPKLDLPFHVRECFARPYKPAHMNCEFPRREATDDLADVTGLLQRTISGLQRAIYFDQTALFCDEQTCSAIRDGLPLLRDTGHYSVYGSTEAMRAFASSAIFPAD